MAVDRITVDDVLKAGHCVRGAKDWFTGHGFDWRDVVRHGASVEDLQATGDALAERVISATEARRNG